MSSDPDLLFDGPKNARQTIALAHGAGAGMDTPFLTSFAHGLALSGFRIARFEFPYMAGYRNSGKRRPPDSQAVLRQTWLRVVELLGRKGLVIGGKSMGGRLASMVADEAGVEALVCLGYPFHPVGKPQQLRVDHLRDLKTRTVILQGERDPFGNRDEVSHYPLSSAIRIHWFEDGDHSFKPRVKSGRTEEENWDAAIAAIARFLGSGRVEA